MSVTLALQMRQHLALTPRLQQSLRLLQLSSLEFQQELRQALDSNPFLEDGQGDDETVAEADAPEHDAAEAAAPEPVPEQSAFSVNLKQFFSGTGPGTGSGTSIILDACVKLAKN